MTVLICNTCPRYDLPRNGEFARAFTAAVRDLGAVGGRTVTIRNVQCLGGCPNHGVVALDDPGKARVRFTGLTDDHAAALTCAASSYDTSDTGHPDNWTVPEPLTTHLSSITAKRLL
jgi:predicted metal-binding protein